MTDEVMNIFAWIRFLFPDFVLHWLNEASKIFHKKYFFLPQLTDLSHEQRTAADFSVKVQ